LDANIVNKMSLSLNVIFINRVLLTLILIVLATFSYAQVTFGLKGGLIITDVYRFPKTDDWFGNTAFTKRNPNKEVKPKAAYNLGALVNVRIHEGIFGQIELLYSDNGYKYKSTERNVSADHDVHLHYVNLPVLLQFAVKPKLKIEYGVEPGYLIATAVSYGRGQKQVDITKKRVYLGNFIGLSYHLLDYFEITTRYSQELPIDSRKELQRAIHLTLGYYFRNNVK
jgi:hypothetical protein